MQAHAVRKTNRAFTPGTTTCRAPQCARLAHETRLAVTGATEVHRALCMPERAVLGDFQIVSKIIPSRHVSGDFIHALHYGNRSYVVLGDLMGKGLSAAMWVTHIVDLVHRAAELSENAGDLLANLNTEILESRVRAPLTSAVVVAIEDDTHNVSVASAGHPPALILRASACVECTPVGGPLLGAFSNARYSTHEVMLRSGDSLVAFSDGLVDCSSGHEDFDNHRIADVLTKNAAAAGAEIAAKLVEAAYEFSAGSLVDDLSVLLVQRS